MRSSTTVVIKNFTITPSLDPKLNGTEAGIYIWSNCDSCTIADCIIAYFNNTYIYRTYYGIRLSGIRCTAYRNILKNNVYGILLDGFQSMAYGNTIQNNTYGVYCYRYDGDGNIVLYDNIMIGNSYGIYCYHYKGNGNNIAKAYANNIIENNYGIYCYTSKNNKFYHNNLINNYVQMYSYASINILDDGLEGNYWSNNVGLDSEPDGICDSPYIIDANNWDNYPLMGKFSKFSITSNYVVQAICNSTITNFKFNGTALRFYVSGDSGTKGFCRINIPTSLMSGPYKVFINDYEVAFQLLPCSNSTHNYLYFAYVHSSKEVIIIPEWSSTLLVLLSTITLTITISQSKRRHK